MEGPERKHVTMKEDKILKRLFWLRGVDHSESEQTNGRNVSDLSKLAILFGLKNWDEQNDNIPEVNRCDLKKLVKGGIRSKGAIIVKGKDDRILLQPGLRLNQWTVDVFIKFPLRSLALDNVLICPEDSTLGAHVC